MRLKYYLSARLSQMLYREEHLYNIDSVKVSYLESCLNKILINLTFNPVTVKYIYIYMPHSIALK